MNFQTILNFVASPFGWIIIFGIFSGAARMFKSAQEQQAKKRDLQKRRQAQHDSLRTGAAASPPPSVQASTDAASTWDKTQDIRQQRIEALRQQRAAQLEKLRQQRIAAQSARTATKPATPRTAQSRPVTQSSQRSLQVPTQRAVQSPVHKPVSPVAQPRVRVQAPQQPIQPILAALQQPPQQRRRSRPSASVVAQSSITTSDEAITLGSVPSAPVSSGSSIRDQFRKDIRRAVIAKEILAQPLGLRAPGSDAMSAL